VTEERRRAGRKDERDFVSKLLGQHTRMPIHVARRSSSSGGSRTNGRTNRDGIAVDAMLSLGKIASATGDTREPDRIETCTIRARGIDS